MTPYLAVRTALSHGFSHDIPQANVMREKRLQPNSVVHVNQVFAKDIADQPPKVILAVRIVLALSQ